MSASRILRTSVLLNGSRLPKARAQTLIRSRTASTKSGVDGHFDDKKDVQLDREKMDRQSYENTGSGTDDAVAGEHELSYGQESPNTPEGARDEAGRINKNSTYNPLEVSAANPDVSFKGTEHEVRNRTAFRPDKKTGDAEKMVRGSGPGKVKTKEAPTGNKTFAGSIKGKADSPSDIARGSKLTSPGPSNKAL